MIILITGKPGIGKSTLMKKLVDSYDKPIKWVITNEIRDSEGQRVGFEAVNDAGKTKIISHKHDIDSTVAIGQNKVDLAAVEQMFPTHVSPGKLTLLDEIGPIQLLSPSFAKSLRTLMSRPASKLLVATIHQSDKRLAHYRNAKNLLLVTVSGNNRDSLPSGIISVLNAHKEIDALKSSQLKRFIQLAREYLNNDKTIQLNKLLNNALTYVENGKIKRTGISSFVVVGKHDNHKVTKRRGNYTCDCDLFNGQGKYKGNAGVCSHIQAVQIRY